MYWTEYLDGGIFGETEYEFEVSDDDIWEYIEDQIVDHVIGYQWDEMVEALTNESDGRIEGLIRTLADNIGPARMAAILGSIQNEEDND